MCDTTTVSDGWLKTFPFPSSAIHAHPTASVFALSLWLGNAIPENHISITDVYALSIIATRTSNEVIFWNTKSIPKSHIRKHRRKCSSVMLPHNKVNIINRNTSRGKVVPPTISNPRDRVHKAVGVTSEQIGTSWGLELCGAFIFISANS